MYGCHGMIHHVWLPASIWRMMFTARVSPLLGVVRSPTTLHLSVAGLYTCDQHWTHFFLVAVEFWKFECVCKATKGAFSPLLFVCCVQTSPLQLRRAHFHPDFKWSAGRWMRKLQQMMTSTQKLMTNMMRSMMIVVNLRTDVWSATMAGPSFNKVTSLSVNSIWNFIDYGKEAKHQTWSEYKRQSLFKTL